MKESNYPLGDSLGQIDHQTIYTSQGNIIDNDEIISDVVDSNGLAVLSDDEEQIRKYIKEAISIDNLVETFNDNAHEALLKLCSLQDNKHPLKKGGMGISYRTDVLIMHCKMAFSAEENIVFDAILGMISSYPDDKVYKLLPSSFQKYAKYADEKYLYKVFKNGTLKLKKRLLVFEIGKDAEEEELDVPWFTVLRYHGGSKKSDDSAFIEFIPTDFFKDLAICSQLVHGAYGSLEVITQLQGKYTIALYWFLESKKGYKEHKNAPTGVFRISLEDLKYQFSMPDSYKANDIRRRALEPAKNSINTINECDFTFDYKEQKVNGVIAGFQFIVTPKKYITSKSKEIDKIEDNSDPLHFQIQTFLTASSLEFSESEVDAIYSKAKECNRDASFMMTIIVAFKQRLDDTNLEEIVDQVNYLCKMIELGSYTTKKTNSINNIPQNTVDYDELEKQLLDN